MLPAPDSKNHQVMSRFLMLRLRRLILALPLAGVLFAAPAQISPQTYLSEVKYLASPELKGRATGSPELETAARYIAGLFKSFGLKPVNGNDYLEPFTVTVNAHLGSGNRFLVNDLGPGTGSVLLQTGRDYTPFAFSSSGKLSGAVVF